MTPGRKEPPLSRGVRVKLPGAREKAPQSPAPMPVQRGRAPEQKLALLVIGVFVILCVILLIRILTLS